MKTSNLVLSMGLVGALAFGVNNFKAEPKHYEHSVWEEDLTDKGLFFLNTTADISSEKEVRGLLKQIEEEKQDTVKRAQSMFVMVNDKEGHLISLNKIAYDAIGKLHAAMDETSKWNVQMFK